MDEKNTNMEKLNEESLNNEASDLNEIGEADDVIEASQHVMKRKVFATIAAMIILLFFGMMLWDSEDGYYISIPTDADQTWTYEIADTSLLENTDVKQENGKFKCFFNGLQEGTTEIIMYRTASDNPQNVLEKRIYHVSVVENQSVLQNSVEREVYE